MLGSVKISKLFIYSEILSQLQCARHGGYAGYCGFQGALDRNGFCWLELIPFISAVLGVRRDHYPHFTHEWMKVKVNPLMLLLSWSSRHHPGRPWLSKPLSFLLRLLPLCLLWDVVTYLPPPNHLRVLTLLHVRFFFHAFLSIAYSHFNYISLIAFHRWAFSIFLSLPLVFK